MSDIMNEYADVCKERDNLRKDVQIFSSQVGRMSEEIDRLKADLEEYKKCLWGGEPLEKHLMLKADRDSWKSKAERYEKALQQIACGCDHPDCVLAKDALEDKEAK